MRNIQQIIFSHVGALLSCASLFVAGLTCVANDAHADVICKKNSTGAITVRARCARGETRLSNMTTLVGPTGASGAVGTAGGEGTTGPSGAQGPRGNGLTGTITGIVRPYLAGCPANNQSGLNGVVSIAGTSYSSTFLANGKFTIYSVAPGSYTLALTSLNGNSFPAGSSTSGFGISIGVAQVVADETTDIGTVTASNTCCGNNVRETNEACDGTDLDGRTCVSQGYASGTLACSNTCYYFDESACVP